MRSPVSKDTKVPSKAIPALHLSASHLLIEPFKKSYLRTYSFYSKTRSAKGTGEQSRALLCGLRNHIRVSSLLLQHCWILLERQEESINIACSPGASIRQSTRLFGAFGSLHKKKMSTSRNTGNLHPRRAYDRRLKMQRSSGMEPIQSFRSELHPFA